MNRAEIKQAIIKRFARMFLRTITFYGRYVDNLIACQKWFDKEEGGVMVQGIYHAGVKYAPVGKANLVDKAAQMLILERMNKEIKDHLRKDKKLIVFYIPKNFVTKQLGLHEKTDHYRLKKIKDSATSGPSAKAFMEKLKREKI